MHISFETLNGRSLTLSLDVEQFLQGPVMSHLAQMQNDCDPAEIIRDYLPTDLGQVGDGDAHVVAPVVQTGAGFLYMVELPRKMASRNMLCGRHLPKLWWS